MYHAKLNALKTAFTGFTRERGDIMYSWEKEKAYKARRAAAAAQEMEAAIAAVDLPRFLAAYETAKRYMNARPRNQYYRRMLAASSTAKNNATT